MPEQYFSRRCSVGEVKSPWVIDVNESDFEREVLEKSRERPVVVDFWAPWCGPCRALGPLLEKLAIEKDGAFVLAKVNTDENQRLAMYFQIEGIPAVKAFRDGQLVAEFEGVHPEPALRQFLAQLLPSEADEKAREAAAMETEKAGEAEANYRRALEQDPNHEASLVGLARLLLTQDADSEAADLVQRVSRGGEHGAEAERLTAVLYLRQLGRDLEGDRAEIAQTLLKEPQNAEAHYQFGCLQAAAGQYPTALASLLHAAELNRPLAQAKVKEVMVKVFQVIGVRSELADEYRDKLTRLLY